MTSKESRVYLLGKKKSDAVARTTERSTKTSGVRIQIIQNKVEISYFSCYLAAICYIAAILCSLRELVNCASSHWGGKTNKQQENAGETQSLCVTPVVPPLTQQGALLSYKPLWATGCLYCIESGVCAFSLNFFSSACRCCYLGTEKGSSDRLAG